MESSPKLIEIETHTPSQEAVSTSNTIGNKTLKTQTINSKSMRNKSKEITIFTNSNKNLISNSNKDLTINHKNIFRKNHNRQISINISSIQSPDHKAIYNVEKIENIDKNDVKGLKGNKSYLPKNYLNRDNFLNSNIDIEKSNSNIFSPNINCCINHNYKTEHIKNYSKSIFVNSSSNKVKYSDNYLSPNNNNSNFNIDLKQTSLNINIRNLSNRVIKSYEGRNLKKYLNKNNQTSERNHSTNSNNIIESITFNNTSSNNLNCYPSNSNSNNSSKIFNNNSNSTPVSRNLKSNTYKNNSNENIMSPFNQSNTNSNQNINSSNLQNNQCLIFNFTEIDQEANISPINTNNFIKNQRNSISFNSSKMMITTKKNNLDSYNNFSKNIQMNNQEKVNHQFNNEKLLKKNNSSISENLVTLNLNSETSILNSNSNLISLSNNYSPIESSNYKSSELNLTKNQIYDKIPNKIEINQKSLRSGFILNFLLERYGEEKFSLLIDLLESSDNPLERLKEEEKLKNIVGDDFQIAQKFLRIVFKNTQNNFK